MRWAGHAARMGDRRGACRVMVGRPEGKGPLGRPRCRSGGGGVILEWILKKSVGRAWTGLIWLRIGTRLRLLCEHGSEPFSSLKCRGFLD
jgi:hypothetical protein